jgi:hypothetical protein
MYMASRIALIGSRIARFSWMAGFVLLLTANSSAQAQQQGSLADAARQVRAQKGNQPGTEVVRAQQVADELSETQNDSAPGGFKTYNASAYKLWVPAPFTMNSDNGGTVLSGPRVGSTMPLVLVGNTLVLQSTSDDAFRDAATQFASVYAGSAKCSKTTLASHGAYECNLAGAKLGGHSISGTAMFIRGTGQIFPVFCVANSDSQARDTLNDPASSNSQKMWARRTLAQEDEYVREVWQKCNSVFQSIHFTESGAQPGSSEITQNGAEVPKSASSLKAAAPPAMAASGAGATGGNSIAAAAAESSVPAGFKAHPFTYCRSQRECWNASVIVPAAAQLVSSDCKQYVFEVKVQGSPFLLLAGPAGGEGCGNRSSSDPSQVRWNELAAPENRRAPGTSSTISSQQTTLDGKPGFITRIGFRKGLTEWMGKRAEIESNGVPLVVGCMAPREHFGDGETICSSLIESLQLP